MDLEGLIDELDDLLQRAVHVPGGKVLIDAATFRQAVQEMREAVPDQLQMGQRIAGERERILADAKAQAQRLTDEARAQMNARLDDQALVQAARQRAKEIQTEAEQRAVAMRTDTNQYIIGQLGALEARLQRLLREVQAGQRVLGQERVEHTEGGSQS
jgi:vacuolar-type H+-ATPase subunit H